jgi:Fe-S-cluster containining protein
VEETSDATDRLQAQLMDMQTIVDDWRANAERHLDRNFDFLHRLKTKSDKAVDRVAHRMHEEAFSIIDCTRCANCCKASSPQFRKSDIRRIAEHFDMKASEFVAKYLKADEDGDLFLKKLPCPFLGTDNRCTIYEVRPQNCAEYPYTQKKGFTFRTHSIANKSLDCPAVFYIVEQMRARRRR